MNQFCKKETIKKYYVTLKKLTLMFLFTHKLFYLLFSLMILMSCTKSTQNKLESTWQLLDISMILPENTIEIWDFNGGQFHRTRITESTNITQIDTIDSGWYQVKGTVLSAKILLDGCGDPAYNSDWEVKELNTDILILLTRSDNNFMYKEFKKY